LAIWWEGKKTGSNVLNVKDCFSGSTLLPPNALLAEIMNTKRSLIITAS
jgi:hypothetical protein